MQITGDMLIGSQPVRGQLDSLQAIDPATHEALGPTFGGGGAVEVDRACLLAEGAFDGFRETAPSARAAFLEAIAQGLLDAGLTLVERAMAESGLPQPRIEGERARTVGQLRFFANIVREGRWVQATIDPALPDRKPLPRPDLRLRRIALGPVAVFGASNFPLAFSVAGGDTASAFAAGCPVVVKAHNAHLGTSEIVGRVIQQAVAQCGLPEGVFSLLIGAGNRIGEDLVAHPAIRAVGFTGSRLAGLSLLRIAQARPVPIPVYAEMSSVNPVFLMPSALASRAESIAREFVDSVVLGVGQFCTNPGLVFAVEGEALDRFRTAAAHALLGKAAGTMLTAGIQSAYRNGTGALRQAPGVQLLAQGQPASEGACTGQPAIFLTTAAHFLADPRIGDEVFGPSSILVACESPGQLLQVAEHLEGQLTATLHLDKPDYPDARPLLRILERKAGRILIDGFPTGVEVANAMVHGGPFPATSDSRATSVGAAAIDRFLRPICYQNFPASLLPDSLRDAPV